MNEAREIEAIYRELKELREACAGIPVRWASGGGGGGAGSSIWTGTASTPILFGQFGDVLTDHTTPQTVSVYSGQLEVPKDVRVTIGKNATSTPSRWEVIRAPTWYPLFGPEEIAKGAKTTIRIHGSDHTVKARYGTLRQNKWWGLQWTDDQAGLSGAGPKYPSTVVNDASTGGTAWTNPNNALTANGVEASSLAALSQYLKATGFGFSLAATTTITGIQVDVLRRNRGPQPYKDFSVRLVKGGSIVGDEKASDLQWPLTVGSGSYFTYGTSADMWGLTLTAADVNAADFGVVVAGQRDGAADIPDARIDTIRMKVFYTGSTTSSDPEIALWIGTELEC